MKQYKFFIAYFSIIFSHFAYAGFISPPPLPQLSSPQLNAMHGLSGNKEENSTSSLSEQEKAANPENLSLVQKLLTLEGETFIQKLRYSENKIEEIPLNSEDDITDLVSLFAKIAKYPVEQVAENFNILSHISFLILKRSYIYFYLKGQEPLFLFLFDSIVNSSNADNVGVIGLYSLYTFHKSPEFGLRPPFEHLLFHIIEEKTSQTRQKRQTVFEVYGVRYVSRYFDFGNGKDIAITLQNIMPTLHILFEKILDKGYFELGKAILDNLGEDNIIKFYRSSCKQSIDLAFLLLEAELRASTLESNTKIQEILEIAKKFKIKAYPYFHEKIFTFSQKVQSKELASLIRSYLDPPRILLEE